MQTPLDELSDSDAFEELCSDILVAEGFSDVAWRGPGADGGRDIDATWSTVDPTGGVLRTKWYVECKWYTQSLPFSEIEPKLFAASAAGADFLLVVTSSRIRNTASDSVEEWLGVRGRPFRVRYWSGRDVLRLAVKHGEVFRRHFPSLPAPSWGNAEARLSRLQTLARSSSDRLQWRVLPTLQWVSSALGVLTKGDSKFDRILDELDLISAMVRAHELFSPINVDRPSTRKTDIAACASVAADRVCRRVSSIRVARIDACSAAISRPMLAVAIFELLLNAAQHAPPGEIGEMSVVAYDGHWVFEVRNPAIDEIPDDWPLFGFRSDTARSRFPAGQGVGCWLAAQAAEAAGTRLTWSKEGDQWIARLEGALT